jgi:hypothetical protein
MNDWISITIAARMLNLGNKRVRQMCCAGVFPTAHKPGSGRNAHWKLLRSEVSAHKFNGHTPKSSIHALS